MSGVLVGRCERCGTTTFPKPEWCATCGATQVEAVEAAEGIVEETTTLRRAVGLDIGPVRIGAVRVKGGAVVLARLEGDARSGSAVQLTVAEGAPAAMQLKR